MKTHGGRYTRLYNTWRDMKRRCNNQNSPDYARYGGRGIRVCDEWSNSFVAFRDWALSNGYADTLTIDRKRNTEGYCPENCRWATKQQQEWNKRKSRSRNSSSRFFGVYFKKRVSRWCAQLNHYDHKKIVVGFFNTQIEAALAYDDAAYELRGEYAHVNFPERIRLKHKEVSHFNPVEKAG